MRRVWVWCLNHGVVSVILVGGVLLTWEGFAYFEVVNPFIWKYLPPPSVILDSFITVVFVPPHANFNAMYHLGITLYRTGLALLIGIIPAVPLGLLLGWYSILDEIFTPIIEFVRPTPGIIILPVFMLFLGFGTPATVATAVVGVFWLLLINSIYGAQSVDREMVRVMRTMGAGDLRLFRSVLLPQSLPFISAGVRTSLGAGLMIVIAVEIVSGNTGLGAMIEIAKRQMATDIVYAGMLISLLTGFTLINLWTRLERWLMPWYFER